MRKIENDEQEVEQNVEYNGNYNINMGGNQENNEMDYIKNLLMKTQMDIESLNDDLDKDDHMSVINSNKDGNNGNHFSQNDNIYHDRTKSSFPKKEPKPMKPYY